MTTSLASTNSHKANKQRFNRLIESLRLRLSSRLGLGDPRFDAFIIGFPKVGNTWLQIMMRKILVSHYGLPDTAIGNILAPREQLPVPMVAMEVTHAMPLLDSEPWREMRLDLSRYRRKRVILIIRDVKDVMVSYYMQNRFRENPPLFDGSIDEMIVGDTWGLGKYLKFYQTWHDRGREICDVTLIRYEDMHESTERELRRAVEAAGIKDVSDQAIHEAVQYGSFDNMRTLEVNDTLGMYALSKPKRDDDRARKVRNGRVGGHTKHLSGEMAQYLDTQIREELPDWYGYPLQ